MREVKMRRMKTRRVKMREEGEDEGGR